MGKLDKQFKREWLNSLRDGSYIKGACQLKISTSKKPKYCCLGVACDISGRGKWIGSAYHYGDGSWIQFLPIDLGKELNISVDQQFKLARLNDTKDNWSDVIRYISRNM